MASSINKSKLVDHLGCNFLITSFTLSLVVSDWSRITTYTCSFLNTFFMQKAIYTSRQVLCDHFWHSNLSWTPPFKHTWKWCELWQYFLMHMPVMQVIVRKKRPSMPVPTKYRLLKKFQCPCPPGFTNGCFFLKPCPPCMTKSQHPANTQPTLGYT
jgi:hypothetical protein